MKPRDPHPEPRRADPQPRLLPAGRAADPLPVPGASALRRAVVAVVLGCAIVAALPSTALARSERPTGPAAQAGEAAAALEALGGLGPAERRAAVAELGEIPAAQFPALAEALARERDPAVRAALARAAGRMLLGAKTAAERARLLGERARRDVAPEVRADAVEALAEAADAPAIAELAALVPALPPAEAAAAARALASVPGAEEAAAALVLEGDLAAPALAALLVPFGRAMAGRSVDAVTARERAPFVVLSRHPDPALRRSAAAGLAAWLGRLMELDRAARADRLLEHLAGEGLDPDLVLARRAERALAGGRDAAGALARAGELARRSALPDPLDPTRSGGERLARSRQLEGLARLALGDGGGAAAAFERAREGFEALAARRPDLASPAGGARLELDFSEAALAALSAAVARLAGGAGPADPEVLSDVRRAHRLALEAQVWAARVGTGEARSLDPLLDDARSPLRLLFADRPHPAWSRARALALARDLGRALATVAPFEAPGFEPATTPVAEDAERLDAAERVVEARLERIETEQAELFSRWTREAGAGETIDRDEFLDELRRLRFRAQREQALRRRGVHLADPELRRPSDLALSLVRELRADGRTEQARALAERLLATLEEGELLARDASLVETAASAQTALAATYTDEGDGERAEEHLLAALERIEALERLVRERIGEEAARGLETRRADVLVSLAVNANVALGDPERALGYFERAWALRQDDFMRVLLACYRARSGRAEEARRVLAGLPPAPALLYNLACTHALLGDRERALALLERDFRLNYPSPGSLARQKAWAAKDPDLASLRSDPRFRSLVGG